MNVVSLRGERHFLVTSGGCTIDLATVVKKNKMPPKKKAKGKGKEQEKKDQSDSSKSAELPIPTSKEYQMKLELVDRFC